MDNELGRTLARVRELVSSLRSLTGADLRGDMHLVDDIGLDSMSFVDLTVSIESAFGIAEFPMQDWLDRRYELDEPITLEALARACHALRPHGDAAASDRKC